MSSLTLQVNELIERIKSLEELLVQKGISTECKQRNYNTTKNKKNNPDRLEMKKYCRFCKKHTVHRETK